MVIPYIVYRKINPHIYKFESFWAWLTLFNLAVIYLHITLTGENGINFETSHSRFERTTTQIRIKNTNTHTEIITISQPIPKTSPIFSPKLFISSATFAQKFGCPSSAISDLRVIVNVDL